MGSTTRLRRCDRCIKNKNQVGLLASRRGADFLSAHRSLGLAPLGVPRRYDTALISWCSLQVCKERKTNEVWQRRVARAATRASETGFCPLFLQGRTLLACSLVSSRPLLTEAVSELCFYLRSTYSSFVLHSGCTKSPPPRGQVVDCGWAGTLCMWMRKPGRESRDGTQLTAGDSGDCLRELLTCPLAFCDGTPTTTRNFLTTRNTQHPQLA